MQVGSMISLRELLSIYPAADPTPDNDKPVQHGLTPLRAKYHKMAAASPGVGEICW
jgi:hypothetical protein